MKNDGPRAPDGSPLYPEAQDTVLGQATGVIVVLGALVLAGLTATGHANLSDSQLQILVFTGLALITGTKYLAGGRR